jgi:hypothetical protein
MLIAERRLVSCGEILYLNYSRKKAQEIQKSDYQPPFCGHQF